MFKLVVTGIAVLGLMGCIALQSPVKVKGKAEGQVSGSVEAEGTVGDEE